MDNRIYICTKVTPDLSRSLQELAFKQGYSWSGKQTVSYVDQPYLYLKTNDMWLDWDDRHNHAKQHKVPLETFLAHLSGSYQEKTIQVKLNSTLTATLSRDKVVVDGYQFSPDKIKKLEWARKQVLGGPEIDFVVVNSLSNRTETIQQILFNSGIVWKQDGNTVLQMREKYLTVKWDGGRLYLATTKNGQGKRTLSALDFIRAAQEQLNQPSCTVKVTMNNSWTAFFEGTERFGVGCQWFDLDVIPKLAEAYAKLAHVGE